MDEKTRELCKQGAGALADILESILEDYGIKVVKDNKDNEEELKNG